MTKKKAPEDLQKVGRKESITAEIKEMIRHAVAIGCTFSQARDYACIKGKKVSETVFFRYLRNNPEFRSELEYLKQNPVLKAKNTIYDNLKDPKWASWYLEKKMPEEFGNQQKIDLSGNIGATLTGDDELKALITGIIEMNKINGNEKTPEEIIQEIKDEERKENEKNA